MMKIFRALVVALALCVPGSTALAQRSPAWIGISFDLRPTGTAQGRAVSAVVTEVRDGSPADAAGILVGDRLISINDVSAVRDFGDLSGRLALQVGDRVRIRLERDGRRVDLDLRAAERPSDLAKWVQTAIPVDSIAEEMFRAMDSLRIQILAMRPPAPPPTARRSPRAVQPPEPPDALEPVDVPFEFFIFRGQQHDSLRSALATLNRRIESLREQEQTLATRLSDQAASRAGRQTLDAQLTELRGAIAQVTQEGSALRAAMAEAARATAAVEYFTPRAPDAPAPPEATFRPLTPYLLGSNRVAGAEVVDVRPGLAQYFQVETGVLVVDVAPGTPAAIAGIQPGDVITHLDRVSVRTVDEMRNGISRAGDTLPITLVRQGSRIEVLLRRR